MILNPGTVHQNISTKAVVVSIALAASPGSTVASLSNNPAKLP